MNVLLIGLRGSGKSSIAKRVAKSTSLVFVEMDDLTPRILNCTTAAQALTTRGEEAFRAAELRALADLLAKDNQIIASGGGSPTAPGAPELIAASSIASDLYVIYLRATAKTLTDRLASTDIATRPSLTGQGSLYEIPLLLSKRDDLYRALADEVIQVDRMTVEETAAQVTDFLLS